nr:MAG TPA: hypothetical protein [Caudoviricetes sp.]
MYYPRCFSDRFYNYIKNRTFQQCSFNNNQIKFLCKTLAL